MAVIKDTLGSFSIARGLLPRKQERVFANLD